MINLQEFAKQCAGNWQDKGECFYWQRISQDFEEAKRWCVVEYDWHWNMTYNYRKYLDQKDPDIFDYDEDESLICIRVFAEDGSITPVFEHYFNLVNRLKCLDELAAQAQELNMGYE